MLYIITQWPTYHNEVMHSDPKLKVPLSEADSEQWKPGPPLDEHRRKQFYYYWTEQHTFWLG